MNPIPQGYILYKGEWCHPSRLFKGFTGSMEYPQETNAALAQDKPKKRIRQSSKPLMNKLETEVLAQLKVRYPSDTFYAQAIKFRLANGVSYTIDVMSLCWSVTDKPAAWEVKGPHTWDDSIVKLKCFATAYPEIRVHLVWKDENKCFQTQDILP